MADLTQQKWLENLQSDENAVIIDVRTAEEYAQGCIPNSTLIDIFRSQDFLDEIEALDKTKSYYVYCRSGARSGQACAVMNQLGFKNAFNLQGGIMEWRGEVVFP